MTNKADSESSQLLRDVTEEEISAYAADGAVVLRQIIPAVWIELMRQATERVLANPGPFGMDYNQDKDTGRFYGDLFMWRSDPGFKTLALCSPLAIIAAQAMGASKVNFFYDQLLVKEPGVVEPTPWHQDLPYWPVNGSQIISIWMPLDSVTPKNGVVTYIKGSHKLGQWFQPQSFTEREDVAPVDENEEYEPMPDIDAQPETYQKLAWSLEPGDCLLHHPLTIHGAQGNSTAACRRRAIATRWTGDDAWFDPRRGSFLEHPTVKPHLPEVSLRKGDPLEHELFPLVWQQGEP